MAFPQWHEGIGLLAGYDYSYFHATASELADAIYREGWEAWHLFPDGQAVAGIAAVFYALLVPEPWTILPLNAVLHATGAYVLLLILRLITGRTLFALPAAIPFLVFPTALAWTAQIHNDSYAITGSLLYLYGWVLLAEDQSGVTWSRSLLAALLVLTGSTLVWIVRPFLVELLLAFGILFLFAIAVIRVLRSRRLGSFSIRNLLTLSVLAAVLLLMAPFAASGSRQPAKSISAPIDSNIPSTIELDGGAIYEEPVQSYSWKETAILPSFIEARVEALGLERRRNLHSWERASSNASNIDVAVQIGSASDLIRYVPRAILIGLLAPFPEMWFAPGSQTSSTAMRRVVGLEMVLVYISLIALPYTLWRWRRSIALWMTLTFCIGMILVYAVVTPNVGALVRFRYAYFMPIVGLGVAGWIALGRRWRLR